ncbi:MAG: class I SAM-dependent methyltransferase [Sphingobium sp.]
MHSFSDKRKFFAEFLRAPRMVGSVIPTSPFVIRRLLAGIDWPSTAVFVEYGPGLGTFTRPILANLRTDARLIAIDTNRSFVDHLGQRIGDPRLEAVHGSAADIEDILAARIGPGARADHILSGLPFSTLPEGVGDAIARATSRALHDGGSFRVYQYSDAFIPFLRPHFPHISRAREWRNIPPCVLAVACKQIPTPLSSGN